MILLGSDLPRRWLISMNLVVLMAVACQADEPVAQPRPSATFFSPTDEPPTPTPTAPELPAQDIVFVYSANGDIYGETIEGERVTFADGPQDEVWPSLAPDGSQLLYQVGTGPPGQIRHLDESPHTAPRIGPGQYPSFAPNGRAAWVVNNAAARPHIVVGPLFSEPEARIVPIRDWDGPIQVNPPLAWDLNGEYLYYAAGWEETSDLYQTDSRGDVDPFPLGQAIGLGAGFHLLGPHVRDRSSVHVFGACCMEGVEDPWEMFELGRARFTESGPVYQTVTNLDRTITDQSFAGWYPQVISLGNLWREEASGRWIETKDSTWIVANQIEAWLVSEGGGIQDLAEILITEHGYRRRHSGGIPGTFEGWSAGPATL
ncbi:MAG TPA: hypothetical protein VHJ82_00680 [Actinomycetota bacterium]|nr:hypothetical protein [Actinomycetota bacterium]